MNLYSSAIARTVREHLENHGIPYDWEEEKGIARYCMGLEGNLHKAQCTLCVTPDSILNYAVFPLFANPRDAGEMMAVMEFLTRANYLLTRGNFELDFRDGEIRYRNTVYCGGISPSDDMIRNAIVIPIAMLERCGEGIIRTLYHTQTPEEAVKQCQEARYNPMDALRAQLRRSPRKFLDGLTSFLAEEMRRYEEEHPEEGTVIGEDRSSRGQNPGT